MAYIQVNIPDINTEKRELLIAELAEAGFDGFEEGDNALTAFIPDQNYDEQQLQSLARQYAFNYTITQLPEQNWNSVWEENFQPVIVPEVCTVRAHFHDIVVNTPYDIQITPKMSFGTGHHATTQLMMMQMNDIDLKNKHVFDFGTGTGILAILAEMMGATDIVAIDNDEWSYENAKENTARNNCKHIALAQGSLENIGNKHFDVILANINRNVLLEYMTALGNMLNPGGILLMSGLLTEDEAIIRKTAEDNGLVFVKQDELNKWIVLVFNKA